jgi:chromosome segregation ATPase
LEHAENLRIAAIEASQLHAEELELLKKQAADDAERKLASIRENFEITLNSELNRVRSEVSSSSEADMQLAYQQVATEYEAKIESVKKKHEEELQNIRSLHEGDKAQLIEESIAKLNLVKEELSNEAAQKNQDVTDRLNIEWKSKLEDTLTCQKSQLENEQKLYKEKVSKYVKDLKSKLETKDSELSDIQNVLQMCQQEKDQLLEAKQKLEAEIKSQKTDLEKYAEDAVGQYIEKVKSLGESRELLKRELENANESIVSLRKEIEEFQANSELKCEEFKKAFETEKNEHDRMIHSLTDRFECEIKELNNRHAEQLLLAEKVNTDKEDYEVVVATMEAEHAHEIRQLKEEFKKADEANKNELASLQSQLAEKSMEVEAMTSSFANEKALVRSEVESFYSENIEKLQADYDAEKAKGEAIFRTVEEQKSVISKLEEEKRAIIEKAKAAFTKQLKTLKEQNSSKIASLEESIELEKVSAADKLKELTESHSAEIEELKSSHTKLISECEKKLHSEIDFLREKMRDQMNYQEKLEGRVKSLTLEIEEASSTSIASITSIQESYDQLEREKKFLEEELSGLKGKLSSSENQVDELLRKLDSLTVALNAMSDTQKKNEDLMETAKKQEEKLAALEKEFSVLQEEGNKLKLEQVQSSGLVARLQAEKDATERKYGQRTALIGMLEAQISELKALNEENKLKLKEMIEVVRKKDDDLRALSRNLERVQAEADSNQHIVESSAMKHIMAERDSQVIQSLQSELQTVQQQMARKSAAAQNLLRQKEVECEKLSEALKKLQKDFDRVGLSDRRIFEIAEKQSNRDSAMSAEIDIRDKLMEKMKDALVGRDGDLASAEYNVKQKEDLLAELGRVQHREDVNLDYLKSTIVQFLSKPPGSSERAALLPVIATLLQVSFC